MPRALLVVPWIYDFSAYDFWSCPVGLLSLAAVLRDAGWEVDYLDFTDRHHPNLPRTPRERQFHTGKYYAEEISKPACLSWVPRRYKRYGLPPWLAEEELRRRHRPDVILVTSRMTYWYPGVADTINLCRLVWRDVPVLLGGTYATLCPEHARRVTGATLVWSGEGENALPRLIEATTGLRVDAPTIDMSRLDSLPFPAWNLRTWNKALSIETSRGCPYHCSYCATEKLLPHWRPKSPSRVADEIDYVVEQLGTEDIAFCDDALLLNYQSHFLLIAKEIERRNIRVRFHTPNSLFASMITLEVAHAMRRMGIETVRISLETANAERLRKLGRRITVAHFLEAMRNLHAAGYTPDQIGVYLLCGLPGQSLDEVRQAIKLVIDSGGTPRLAEYSPIPGTKEWATVTSTTSVPLADEPLLQNNSIYWWASGAFTPAQMQELKRWIREATHNLKSFASESPNRPE